MVLKIFKALLKTIKLYLNYSGCGVFAKEDIHEKCFFLEYRGNKEALHEDDSPQTYGLSYPFIKVMVLVIKIK